MFSDGLRPIENYYVSKLVALERGRNVVRQTRWNYLAANDAIKRLARRLDNQDYTVGQFLEAASYQIENLHNQLYNQVVNVYSEDEDVGNLVPAWLPPDDVEPVAGRGRGRGRGAARGRGAVRGRAAPRVPAAEGRGAAQRRGRGQGVNPPVQQLVSSSIFVNYTLNSFVACKYILRFYC